MLTAIVKELETELNSLTSPSIEDLTNEKLKNHQTSKHGKKKQANKNELDVKNNLKLLDEVDLTYEEKIESKALDITDEKVKDRWSRYIGAMGIDAVAK
jgi:hypothetical protein